MEIFFQYKLYIKIIDKHSDKYFIMLLYIGKKINNIIEE